ncbi:MAG: LptF/LptG family permease [Deltaproteobacteria bacterium]|nr:LptF/LptG family permease [Deltaproteobacteria bacterium]
MIGRRTLTFLLRRGLRAALVAGAALGLLLLLVDWVEAGARGEGGVTATLLVALLEAPGHLARGAPLMAALAAALAVAGLVRAGEWQALGIAGLGPRARLAPLALVGLLVGGGAAFLQETTVPAAAQERARRGSEASGGPLRVGEEAWISSENAVFRVTLLEGWTLGPSSAWRRLPGPFLDRQVVASLAWDGTAWRRPDGPVALPWSDLPPPSVIDALGVPGEAADRPWASLAMDRRPAARAEIHTRWSRPLSCVPAALVGAAVPATLGAAPFAVVLGLLPTAAWEVVASALQSAAGQGVVPPALGAWLRLLLALLATGLALRPLGRPGPSG